MKKASESEMQELNIMKDEGNIVDKYGLMNLIRKSVRQKELSRRDIEKLIN